LVFRQITTSPPEYIFFPRSYKLFLDTHSNSGKDSVYHQD
jgi:hypothetical protein